MTIAVAAMHAVEVADGGDERARAGLAARRGERKSLHQAISA